MVEMVKRLTLAASVLCCTAMVEAMPLHGLYVKAAGGTSVFHNSTLRKAGRRVDPILQVGVGFTPKKGIRADLSFYYTGMPNKAFNTTRPGQKTDSTVSMDSTIPNLKQHSVMLNLHYDLPVKDILTPYFSAGAGWSETKGYGVTTSIIIPSCPNLGGGVCPPPEAGPSTSTTFKSNGLAFNIGFGFTVPLTQMASLDCSYKFFVHPKLKSNDPQISRSLKMHTVMIGLTFSM